MDDGQFLSNGLDRFECKGATPDDHPFTSLSQHRIYEVDIDQSINFMIIMVIVNYVSMPAITIEASVDLTAL